MKLLGLKQEQLHITGKVTNFTKPNKDKLVVYELLIRDFDADRNYQNM